MINNNTGDLVHMQSTWKFWFLNRSDLDIILEDPRRTQMLVIPCVYLHTMIFSKCLRKKSNFV